MDLICKVKPDANHCCSCIDIQEKEKKTIECETCDLVTREYEIISLGHSFWKGDYAMVLDISAGTIQRVSLDRIYDVKYKSCDDRVITDYGAVYGLKTLGKALNNAFK